MGYFGRKQFFNPASEADRDQVREHLQAFVKADNTLMSIDRWLAPLTGADILCVCTSSYLSAVALTLAVYFLNNAFERSRAEEDRTAKLNQLMETYHWMLSGKDASITKDDLFMDVVEAIAPYVQTKELTPWILSEVSPQHFSNRYRKVLSSPLHQVEVPRQPESSSSSLYENILNRLPSYSAPETEIAPQSSPEPVTNANVLAKVGLYAEKIRQSSQYAKSVRYIYGYKDPEEVKAPAPMSMRR